MIRPEILCPSWPIKPLSEVVEFLDHLRKPVTAKDRIPGPYPYYGANGQQDSVAGYIFDEPLILLAEDGGYFGDPNRTIAYRIEGKSRVNNHAHVLRPRNGVDLGFLCRQLERYDVTKYISGTTRAKLNKRFASEIPVVLPPLSEQKRIAAILDKADAIRKKRQKAIELIEGFLQSAFLEMFGNLNANSKSFKLLPLGKVANRIVVGHVGPTSEYYTNEGVPFLRTGNVRRMRIDPIDHKIITLDFHKRLKKSQLHQGDVLVSRVGANRGMSAVVPSKFDGANCANIIIVTPGNLLDPHFLAYVVNSDFGQKQLLGVTVGSAQGVINTTSVKEWKVPLPSTSLQGQFGDIARKVFDGIGSYEMGLSRKDNLFNSLTQQAFKGEL